MSRAATPNRPRWRRFLGGFWGQLLLALVVTGLVVSFVAKPYTVPSASMESTLQPGDRILVNRLAYRLAEPVPGDVVVFEATEVWDTDGTPTPSPLRAAWLWFGQWTGFGPSGPHTLVKRVIATPGQTASCCSTNGKLVVAGTPIDEPYVSNDLPFEAGTLDCTTTPRSSRCFDEVTVPAGSYLMLGDNRSNSSDSAWRCRTTTDPDPASCWRWATRDGIVGTAQVIFWPLTRVGGVRR